MLLIPVGDAGDVDLDDNDDIIIIMLLIMMKLLMLILMVTMVRIFECLNSSTDGLGSGL